MSCGVPLLMSTLNGSNTMFTGSVLCVLQDCEWLSRRSLVIVYVSCSVFVVLWPCMIVCMGVLDWTLHPMPGASCCQVMSSAFPLAAADSWSRPSTASAVPQSIKVRDRLLLPSQPCPSLAWSHQYIPLSTGCTHLHDLVKVVHRGNS